MFKAFLCKLSTFWVHKILFNNLKISYIKLNYIKTVLLKSDTRLGSITLFLDTRLHVVGSLRRAVFFGAKSFTEFSCEYFPQKCL